MRSLLELNDNSNATCILIFVTSLVFVQHPEMDFSKAKIN